MVFPLYRKYSNLDSYFVITSPTTWVEYKRLGKKYLRYEFTAEQFPEKLFIKDLIALVDGIVPSSAKEITSLSV